jgi:hypothetical protein
MVAEGWTVEGLRRLRRKGWRLANGMTLRGNAHVDHIVVGPPGLLVVETKWSASAWPFDTQGAGFMVSHQQAAVEQAARNRKTIETESYLMRARSGAPVRAALVLWSTDDSPDNASRWFEAPEGVTVVDGLALDQWLQTLDDEVLRSEDIGRVWDEINLKVDRRDAHDATTGRARRPTLVRSGLGWLIYPYLGFSAAFTVLVALQSVGGVPFELGYGLISLLAGLLLVRSGRARKVAVGWTTAAALFVGVYAGVIVLR